MAEVVSYDAGSLGEVKVEASGHIGSLTTVAKGLSSGPAGIKSIMSLAPLMLGPIGAPIAMAGQIFGDLFGLFDSDKKDGLTVLSENLNALSDQVAASTEYLANSINVAKEQIIDKIDTIATQIESSTLQLVTELQTIQTDKTEFATFIAARMDAIVEENNLIIDANFNNTLAKIEELNQLTNVTSDAIIDAVILESEETIQATIDIIYTNLQPTLQNALTYIQTEIDNELALIAELAERKKYLLELQQFSIVDYFDSFIAKFQTLLRDYFYEFRKRI